jgi:hypothetical protein
MISLFLSAAMAWNSPVSQAPTAWTIAGTGEAFMTCARRGGEALASSARSAEAIATRVVRICAPLMEASLTRQHANKDRARPAALRTMHDLVIVSVNRTRRIS